jgi:hypothetical protein
LVDYATDIQIDLVDAGGVRGGHDTAGVAVVPQRQAGPRREKANVS